MPSWSSLSAGREFLSVVRELNPAEIQDEVGETFRIGLIGPAGAGKSTLGYALAGPNAPWPPELDEHPWEPGAGWRPLPDLSLYVLDATRGPRSDLVQLLARQGPAGRQLAVFTKLDAVADVEAFKAEAAAALGPLFAFRTLFVSALTDPHGAAAQVGAALLENLPNAELALGRRFPALRPLVSRHVILRTCRVNSEFALLSSLPANIPLVGGVVGASADSLVLTKNQVMMLLRLAAIHGRPVRVDLQMALELAPVVGAAFAWRTLARTLLEFLPSPIGAIPKTGVAFGGTYIVGKLAEYYYATGLKPPPGAARRFAQEASELVRRWRPLGDREPKAG